MQKGEHIGAGINLGVSKGSMSRVSVNRASLARVSAGGRYTTGGIPGVGGRMSPSPAMLERASIVRVH